MQSEKSTRPVRPPNRGKIVSPPSSTSLRYLIIFRTSYKGFDRGRGEGRVIKAPRLRREYVQNMIWGEGEKLKNGDKDAS